MEEELVQWPDILANDTTEFGQQSDRLGSSAPSPSFNRTPSLDINFLRGRQFQHSATTDKQNGKHATQNVSPAKTDTPTTNPWLDFIALESQIEKAEQEPEILPKVGDTLTYEQIEKAFEDCLQKLEILTDCQQPIDEQIPQLEALVSQLQQDLVQMRQAMAKAFTTRKRTEKQYNFAQSTANNWQPRAKIAGQNGDETLAKEALVRQKANASIAASLRFSLDLQAPHFDTLKWHIIDVEIQIYQAKTQKELLTALAKAPVIKQIQTTFKTRLQELETLTSYEHPNKEQIQCLESLILQMQEDLVQIRNTTANVITAQKNTQHQYNIAQSLANNWQRRAQMAGQNRDEEQLKEVSIRHKADADTAGCLRIILDLQTTQVELLKYNLTTLEITISQAKTKKELFKVHASLQNTIDRWDSNAKPSLEPSQQDEMLMIKLDDIVDKLD